MFHIKNYYKILEVQENASAEVIKVAYKALAKKYHPDMSDKSDRKINEEYMKELNLAKEILLDPIKRKEYDLLRKKENEKQEKIKQHNSYSDTDYKTETKKTYRQNDSKIKNTEKTQSKTKTKTKANDDTLKDDSFFVDELKKISYLLKNYSKYKKLIWTCLGLFVAASLQIVIVFYLFTSGALDFEDKPKEISNPYHEEYKNDTLSPGMSKEEVITMFGRPDGEYSAYLKYGTAQVLLKDNLVIGWVDTYKVLPMKRYTTTPKTNMIKLGTTKESLLKKFGVPDTYTKELIVYDNILIYFEEDKVIKVEEV